MVDQRFLPSFCARRTLGRRTEAIASAVRRPLDHEARSGRLFGAHRDSVRIREGVGVITPALDAEPDAETGREFDR